ncbi:glycosyltransferase family 4 protein [Thalassobellus suaedae]|uniref:Glycosyltransferase family 4 protein n=1 Tax=Thalassobellus suaedae TaxID=3074124 RepID=A0ABY9Y2C5_9FLAO|nr:glycosyltransferase family 4 protein [Flavobacteriaceae bacterium HL-DH10]
MSKKILFTASVAGHFKAFHLPYLKWFQEQGFETHIACNETTAMKLPFVDKTWNIDFARNPFSLNNIRALRQLKEIIDRENYTLVNCHTPTASVVTRLACIKARKNGTILIYTAHGFHFYKGAPFIYWALFFPVEILLAKISDAVITINTEDYLLIKKYGAKNTDYYLIPGIGVDKSSFYPVSLATKTALRKEKKFPLDKKILIYAAEFIPRKNHQFIIDSVSKYREMFTSTVILFAGNGRDEESLKKYAESLKVNHIIKFIGFRRDIHEIYKLADIGISTSKQEGLGLNLVEEMMCGLPLIASEDRGHKEIIDHNLNGFLYPQNNKKSFSEAVHKLNTDSNLYSTFSENGILKAEKFELSSSLKAVTNIYKNYL